MARYKHIIFDVDGTLLDTSEGLIASTRYMINELNYKMPSDEIVESFVGPRIQDSLKRVYGLYGEELDRAAGIFRSHYKEFDVLKASPYEGMMTLLERLYDKGIRLTVATNKRQDFTEMLMEKNGITKYLSGIYGTDLAGKLTKKDLINEAILDAETDSLGIEDAVLIGDSEYDAIGANEAGVSFVGVTYGFGFRSKEDIEKFEPVASVDTVSELYDLLMDKEEM